LWFPAASIPTGTGKPAVFPVLVMVCSHSRFIMAVMLPSRRTGDLLAGMWLLLQGLGAVPRRLIWDNEAGIGRRNNFAAGVAAFAGVLAARIVQVKPYDPETKGIVERANQFLETSFLPGRTFASPADFNAQLAAWLPVANRRMVRRTGASPAELVAVDRAAMMALPPVEPVTGFRARVRLPRDYYVRVASNDYSVHPRAIGRFVDIAASLEMVTVTLDGKCVASHPRSWGSALTLTDPTHVAAARSLRQVFQNQLPPSEGADPPLRDLADYDRAFGVVLDDCEVGW
jgi:hypothetical protein